MVCKSECSWYFVSCPSMMTVAFNHQLSSKKIVLRLYCILEVIKLVPLAVHASKSVLAVQRTSRQKTRFKMAERQSGTSSQNC